MQWNEMRCFSWFYLILFDFILTHIVQAPVFAVVAVGISVYCGKALPRQLTAICADRFQANSASIAIV